VRRFHLAPPGLQRDLPALLQTVREQGITHLTLAPSTARALVDDPQLPACTSLRYVQFGGEPLDAALAARFQSLLPQATLLNYYGPSETTEDSTLYVVDGPITQTRGNLPVGDRSTTPAPTCSTSSCANALRCHRRNLHRRSGRGAGLPRPARTHRRALFARPFLPR
jgi:Non-ribosomal peptide synthetase modules and related proteins